jgi:hypothetical protein
MFENRAVATTETVLLAFPVDAWNGACTILVANMRTSEQLDKSANRQSHHYMLDPLATCQPVSQPTPTF